jgi:S1-C subfamily serine protease
LLRLDARHDVALLSVKAAGSTPCLALRTGSPAVSEEVYAVGAPLADQLAFSMTRGILSGHREIDGLPLLQIDANVNAGNSGGPLVDHEGRLIGVVRSKVVGAGVEGVAFAIPAAAAQARLGIRAGTSAAAALLKPSPQAAAARPAPALRDDTPDMPIGAVAPTPALRPAPATTQGPPGTTSTAYTPPPAQTNQTLSIIGGVVIAAVIVGGLSVLLLSTGE